MKSRFVIACTWAMLGIVLPLTWGATGVLAQDKPTLGPTDYDQWERLGGAVLSGNAWPHTPAWLFLPKPASPSVPSLQTRELGAPRWGSNPLLPPGGRLCFQLHQRRRWTY